MFKVSYATFVDVGLVGPKASLSHWPRVVDGQQVNIPVPMNNRYELGWDGV